ncbi:MAG TPA: NAD(P)H-dependent glycerol-3-phosphate dehydrogenase [Ktedonobacterales bacterium]|nr:NAD(P)H-dependent glycerol-3-phosphate dehydrogenase [Ktedonobacterales bacterium]
MAGVTVLGTGAWGTTLARLLADERLRWASDNAATAETVMLWEHLPERAAVMERARENHDYLPGIRFPPNLRVTADLAEALHERTLVLVVTPSQRVREQAKMVAPLLTPGTIVACASKGLELGTRVRMSQVIRQELPDQTPIVALSGPNLAMEIARGLPAAAVVASDSPEAAEKTRTLLTTGMFRVYSSDDVAGVELGGALKNIIALGVGISDGLGYGDNAKAAFMTRALAEISRLAMAAGANPLTLAGLAGLGDLIATCSSSLSRNRTLGLELAKGRSLEEVLAERKTVAEGVTTTRAALELAETLHVELPITEQIACVLFENKDVKEAVRSLMLRDPKHELYGLHEL